MAMCDEPPFKPRQIIKCTITITTVETWTITVGFEQVTATPEPDGTTDTVSVPIGDPEESNHWENTPRKI